MNVFSVTRRDDGNFAIDETGVTSLTGHDPAIMIGLSLAFWRTGGLKAIPDILIQKLEYMAAIDASAECVWWMVSLRNRQFVGSLNRLEPVQAVEADREEMACFSHSKGNRHD